MDNQYSTVGTAPASDQELSAAPPSTPEPFELGEAIRAMTKPTTSRIHSADTPLDVVVSMKPFAVTQKTMSELTGISIPSISRLIREGKLAARYFGATVLVDYESMESFYRSLPSERVVERECAANRSLAA